MERFHIIPEAEAIVRSRGVFKQVKVYQRAGAVYVGVGGGFVRLYMGGNTGQPNLAWDDIDIPGVGGKSDLKGDPTGKLSMPPAMKTIEGNSNK